MAPNHPPLFVLGAVCELVNTTKLESEFSHQVYGVALPVSASGFWLGPARRSWMRKCPPAELLRPQHGGSRRLWDEIGSSMYYGCVLGLELYPCDQKGRSCPGGFSALSTNVSQCSAEFVGDLCGQCAPGYYRAPDNLCKLCSGVSVDERVGVVSARALLVALFVCCIVFIVWKLRGGDSDSTSSEQASGKKLSEKLELLVDDEGKLKIFVSYAQIMFSFSTVYTKVWPAECVSVILLLELLHELNLYSPLLPGCASFWTGFPPRLWIL